MIVSSEMSQSPTRIATSSVGLCACGPCALHRAPGVVRHTRARVRGDTLGVHSPHGSADLSSVRGVEARGTPIIA